jgi:hypothetical protein
MRASDCSSWRTLLACDEASRLISHSLDRSLSLAERTALRLHLMLCPACRRFRRNLRLLRELLADVTKWCLTNDPPVGGLRDDERTRVRVTLTRAASTEF